jgi:HEAT repeat protein
MRRTVALFVATLACPAAWSVDAPDSIANARIEVKAGTSPASAAGGVGRGTTAEWLGWSVPARPDVRSACCFTDNFKRRGCSLAGRDTSWGTSDDFARGDAAEMYVLVERKGGSPTRVRVISPSCPVDGADRRLVWLGPVEAKSSLDALSRMLDVKTNGNDVDEPALVAIAYHQDAAADALIEKRAFDRSLSTEARQQAIFWAGNTRGEAGYRLIERVLTSEPSGELREHAVFALTQSSVPEASARIKRVALEDRDSDVRAQALFWLAQTNVEGAGEWIVGRLDTEQDDHVREQAVFALSQLNDGTDWLLKLLRSKRDTETIRRALFWLGQSKDPRALAELTKILEK